MSGSTVYAGGQFASIGGQSRNRIAALDVTTGEATDWNPNAGNDVYALAVSGSTIYAGGNFNSIGGESRNRIAALDVSTGAATGWNPNASGTVWALAVSGSTVYAGGQFGSIGGQPRSGFAAFDLYNNPLPVEWLGFSARPDAHSVHLDWVTASEINTSHFEIQRSVDAVHFDNIGTIGAAGNSAHLLNYYWLDSKPLKGLSYYRIRQIDYDGAYTYSVIRAVEYSDAAETMTVFYDGNNIQVFSDCDQLTNAALYNVSGQYISISNSSDKRYAPRNELTTGIYFLTTICNGQPVTLRFLVH